MVVDGFDWDKGNLDKCQGHGLTRDEVESVFTIEPFVYPNAKHESKEVRYHAVGLTNRGRHAFVVFTFRDCPDGSMIRPISARYMHQKEVEHYEREKKK